MVIHDPEQKELWTEERVTREAEKAKPVKEKRKWRWSVIAVQSLACVLIVVFALTFRLIGGDVYEELRQEFHTALQNNELVAVLSRLWDGDPFENVSEVPEEDVKQSDFTNGEASIYAVIGDV